MRRTSSWRSRWSPKAAGGSAVLERTPWKRPTPVSPMRPNRPYPIAGLGARIRRPGFGDRRQAHRWRAHGRVGSAGLCREEEAKGEGCQPGAQGRVRSRSRGGAHRCHRARAGPAKLFTERVRPAMPGSGLGHTAVTVGTFGCLVREKGTRPASTYEQRSRPRQ